MKIGFDARMISHPGIGRYIRSLVPEIVKKAPEDRFILFGDPEKLEKFLRYDNVDFFKWDTPIYSVWEQFLPLYARMKLDLLHVPHFNVPLFSKKKIVATIHDLIYLLFPESSGSPLGKRYVNFMVKSALEKSNKVLTVSEHTKNDLVNIFGVNYSEKFKFIFEACSKGFRKL